MVQAGFVTLLHMQASDQERVQLALIWVASINLNLRYQLLPPILLHPFSKGWQIHEETVIATMQIRMQAVREIEHRSECSLAELRPGVFAHPKTAALRVGLPLGDALFRLQQLPKFQLQNGTDLLPGTLAVGDSSEAAVSVTTGGFFRAAEGQSKW
jgi:hypothetical protein